MPLTAVELPRRQADVLADPAEVLTQRQLEFMSLYASGYSYRDIANAKFVSYNTVRTVLETARSNVGAGSLTHLCVLAVEAGVIVRNGVGYKPVVDPYVAD